MGSGRRLGRVAQSVEQGIENPRVGGSIPSPATTFLRWLLCLTATSAGGCAVLNDRCERLCIDVSLRLDACMDPGMGWEDFDARSRLEYANDCRRDWQTSSNALASRELELALLVCGDTRDQLDAWTCDEVMSLYGPLD